MTRNATEMTYVVLAYGENYKNRIGVGNITDAGTEMGRFINEGAGRVSIYGIDPVKAELICTTTVTGWRD